MIVAQFYVSLTTDRSTSNGALCLHDNANIHDNANDNFT